MGQWLSCSLIRQKEHIFQAPWMSPQVTAALSWSARQSPSSRGPEYLLEIDEKCSGFGYPNREVVQSRHSSASLQGHRGTVHGCGHKPGCPRDLQQSEAIPVPGQGEPCLNLLYLHYPRTSHLSCATCSRSSSEDFLLKILLVNSSHLP